MMRRHILRHRRECRLCQRGGGEGGGGNGGRVEGGGGEGGDGESRKGDVTSLCMKLRNQANINLIILFFMERKNDNPLVHKMEHPK